MNRTESASSAVSDRPVGQNVALRFHGVRYLVTDVSRAVAFYTRHFGFTLEHQQLPAFATVSLGDLKLLLSGPEASGSRPMPDGRLGPRPDGRLDEDMENFTWLRTPQYLLADGG